MSKLLRKSFVTRPLAIVVILAFMNMSFTLAENEVVLRAGTVVPLEVLNDIKTSHVTMGQIIDFRVTREITVDRQVVIPFGAIAKGQVVRLEKRRGVGKGASMQVQIRSVTATDGREVMLTGGNLSGQAGNRVALPVVLTVLFVCPLFLLIKGKNAVIPAGMSVSATVASDTYVKL